MVEENQEDTMSLKAKEENFARINPLKNSGKSSLSGAYSLTIIEDTNRSQVEGRRWGSGQTNVDDFLTSSDVVESSGSEA